MTMSLKINKNHFYSKNPPQESMEADEMFVPSTTNHGHFYLVVDGNCTCSSASKQSIYLFVTIIIIIIIII